MIETSHKTGDCRTDLTQQVLRCDRCNKAARWLRGQASTLGWRTAPNAKRDICPDCTKSPADEEEA